MNCKLSIQTRKASTTPRFSSSRARAAVLVPRAQYYAQTVSNGIAPAPLALSVTATTPDDNFAKLNAAYYKAFIAVITSPGEAVQLFTPYRTILTTDDTDLLTHMDGKPPFNLIVTTDAVPQTVFALNRARTFADNASVEPTAGYFAVYKSMVGDFKVGSGASQWITLLKSDNTWSKWQTFRQKPEWINKLVNANMVKNFVFGATYSGELGEQVYQSYVQNSLQLPGSALSNVDAFLESDPAPAASDYYRTKVTDVMTSISAGQSSTVSFTFKQQSTDLSKTWAEGRVGGAYSFFSASGSTQYDHISKTFSSSTIQVTISMDHVGTVVVDGKQGAWFDLAALTSARNQKSGLFQDDQKYFNHFNTTGTPKGDIVYAASELVVAKGVNVKLDISLDESQYDLDEVKVAASAGFWPFFSASGSSDHKTEVNKVDKSKLRITSNSTNADQMFIVGRKVYNVFDK